MLPCTNDQGGHTFLVPGAFCDLSPAAMLVPVDLCCQTSRLSGILHSVPATGAAAEGNGTQSTALIDHSSGSKHRSLPVSGCGTDTLSRRASKQGKPREGTHGLGADLPPLLCSCIRPWRIVAIKPGRCFVQPLAPSLPQPTTTILDGDHAMHNAHLARNAPRTTISQA